MRRTVRLTERDLTRIVKRVIKEEELGMTDSETSTLPKCKSKMKQLNDMVGSNTLLNGPIDKITGSFTGFTVHKNGKGFCFIPSR